MNVGLRPKHLHVLLLAAVIMGFTACTGAVHRRLDGRPVAFPYTIGTILPLRFEVTQQGHTLFFNVVCHGTGRWQAITLDVRAGTTTNTSSTRALSEAPCLADESSIFAGSLFNFDGLKVGEDVNIFFDVRLEDGRAARVGQTLIVGQGKALYLADATR